MAINGARPTVSLGGNGSRPTVSLEGNRSRDYVVKPIDYPLLISIVHLNNILGICVIDSLKFQSLQFERKPGPQWNQVFTQSTLFLIGNRMIRYLSSDFVNEARLFPFGILKSAYP